MSHTPGPWRWVETSDGWVLYGWGCYASGITVKEDDAHLIEAAPDLLAACKAALGAFENNNCIDWNDLKRAIAKAEANAKNFPKVD